MDYLNKSSRGADNNIDKLPFFLNKTGSPKTWFQLLEAKFDFSAMSSSNKFYQTISCLPPDILKILSDDLVTASSSCNPYNYLKDILTDYYKSSPNDIIKNYFSKNYQKGLKPSVFLDKAIHDLESQHPGITKDYDQVLRQCFLSSLPSDINKIVNGISNIELIKLAQFADKIYEKQPNNLNELYNEQQLDEKSTINHLTNELIILKNQVQTLQEKYEKLEQKINLKNTINKSSSRKSSSSSQSPTIVPDFNNISNDNHLHPNYCFYHAKYGTGAKKCQLGCTYQPKSIDLQISNICIHHARKGSFTSQCMFGCTRYSTFDGHSSR